MAALEVKLKGDTIVIESAKSSESEEYLVGALHKACENSKPVKLMHHVGGDGTNEIFSIPEQFVSAIVNLDFLVELDLSNLSLSRSNLVFGNMSSLKFLTLDKANLRHLHPSIGRLENLEMLSLRHNHLYDLPVTMRLLRKLQYLNITGNLFRSLPGAVYHMTSLKRLEGLQDNLLEKNPHWNKENHFITSTPPLEKELKLLALDNVEKLSNISIRYAVGLNVWAIPLPDQYRTEIIDRSILSDLCEGCLAPVRKIMEDQETDGFLLKVCLVKFSGMRNVPFKFLTCSASCRDSVVERFLLVQNGLLQQLQGSDFEVPEVSLKDQHYRAEPFRPGQGLESQSKLAENEGKESSGTASKCAVS